MRKREMESKEETKGEPAEGERGAASWDGVGGGSKKKNEREEKRLSVSGKGIVRVKRAGVPRALRGLLRPEVCASPLTPFYFWDFRPLGPRWEELPRVPKTGGGDV